MRSEARRESHVESSLRVFHELCHCQQVFPIFSTCFKGAQPIRFSTCLSKMTCCQTFQKCSPTIPAMAELTSDLLPKSSICSTRRWSSETDLRVVDTAHLQASKYSAGCCWRAIQLYKLPSQRALTKVDVEATKCIHQEGSNSINCIMLNISLRCLARSNHSSCEA